MMKKKITLLGAALVISVVSAQAAFASTPVKETVGKVSIEATQSKLDLSNVKVGQAKAVDVKLKGILEGTTKASTADAIITLEAVESKLDLSNVKVGKAKAIGGKLKSILKGGTKASITEVSSALEAVETKLDLSNVKLEEAKSTGILIEGTYNKATTAKK